VGSDNDFQGFFILLAIRHYGKMKLQPRTLPKGRRYVEEALPRILEDALQLGGGPYMPIRRAGARLLRGYASLLAARVAA